VKNKINIYLIITFILLPFSHLQAQSWKELNDSLIKYYNHGNYKTAAEFGEKALEQAEKEFGKRDTNYAKTLSYLAKLYCDMAEYEEAEPMIKEALQIYKAILGKKHAYYANCKRMLADLYEDIGQYDIAERLYNEILQIYKELFGEKHTEFATTLNSLAILFYDKGLYDKCESTYEKALHIRKEIFGIKHPDYAKLLFNLANLYYVMGRFNEAEPLYKEASQIFKEVYGEKHLLYANALNSLGAMYSDMGLYDEAEKLYKEAMEIRKDVFGEKHPLFAHCINNLAIVYMKTGMYDKAEPLFIKAIQIYKETSGESDPDYAASLNNLAILYLNTKQYDKAEPLIKKSLSIIKELFSEEHPDYADFLNSLANLYSYRGQNSEAEKLYKKTLQIRKEVLGVKHPNYAESLSNLASLYFDIGKYNKARKFFTDANKNFLVQFKTYFPVLSEKEKLIFLKRVDEFDFQIFNSFCLHSSEQDPFLANDLLELSIAKKGLILSSAIDVRKRLFGSKDSLAIDLFNMLTNLRMAIANAYTLTIDEQQFSGINLDSLESEANDIEKELSRKSESVKIEIEERNITWKDIQNKLKSDETAIEFIDFRYYNKQWTDTTYYCALVIRPEYQYPKLVKLCTEKELEQYLSISADNNNSYVRNNNSSNSLYNLIWKPIERYLNGVNTVYISPSGLLNRVSYYALSNSNNELLTDKYSIRYLTNLKDVVTNKPERKVYEIPGFIASVFGGAVFDMDSVSITDNSLKFKKDEFISRGSDLVIDDSVKVSYSNDVNYFSNGKWNYLEGTKEEAENIAGLFQNHNLKVALYTGTIASEDAVKSSNYTNSPTILHISTHGYFFPEPPKHYSKKQFESASNVSVFKASDNPLFRSGLILAGANWVWSGNKPIESAEDGILTAYEVSNIDLTNTELVVLSACETGLGDIKGSEGVFGLQRAFKVAGANSILMSLWKVPDKETVELMNLFYTNWLSGKTKYESLHQAQLEMRKKYDPYYWAAFVLVE